MSFSTSCIRKKCVNKAHKNLIYFRLPLQTFSLHHREHLNEIKAYPWSWNINITRNELFISRFKFFIHENYANLHFIFFIFIFIFCLLLQKFRFLHTPAHNVEISQIIPHKLLSFSSFSFPFLFHFFFPNGSDTRKRIMGQH